MSKRQDGECENCHRYLGLIERYSEKMGEAIIRIDALSTAIRRFSKAVHPVLRGLAVNRVGVPEASRQTAQEAEAAWTEYEAADAVLKNLGVWS